MVTQSKDLWTLVHHSQQIDPRDLTAAIEEQVNMGDLDYRTCVLIRDSLKALRHYWGPQRVAVWLEASPAGQKIESICKREWDDDRGFPSLMRRVMDVTQPETIRQFLQEISSHAPPPARIRIGGAVALILAGFLLRRTDRVDLVDETRADFALLPPIHAEIENRYGLGFARFPPRCLPQNWQQRIHFLDSFGQLRVYLIDVYDVFLSKLTSKLEKDFFDLRELAFRLDKAMLASRLSESTASLFAASDLRQRAEHNWYVLYGEPLPS